MWYAMECRLRNGVTGSGQGEFAEFALSGAECLQSWRQREVLRWHQSSLQIRLANESLSAPEGGGVFKNSAPEPLKAPVRFLRRNRCPVQP
jgi:hypothetical protein